MVMNALNYCEGSRGDAEREYQPGRRGVLQESLFEEVTFILRPLHQARNSKILQAA